MNRMTDDDRKTIMSVYYDQIENAVKTAKIHMAGGTGSRPEIVDYMFEFIGHLATRGQQYNWPDPAKRVQAAQQDTALQQLLKRTSKPTPIRAGRTLKGGAQ